MPSLDLLPRQIVDGAATASAALPAACETLTLSIVRYGGDGVLMLTSEIDGAPYGGGGSDGSWIETIEGPFEAGQTLTASLSSAAPLDVAVVMIWG